MLELTNPLAPLPPLPVMTNQEIILDPHVHSNLPNIMHVATRDTKEVDIVNMHA
jgi:hypothetical protein